MKTEKIEKNENCHHMIPMSTYVDPHFSTAEGFQKWHLMCIFPKLIECSYYYVFKNPKNYFNSTLKTRCEALNKKKI